MKRLLKLCMMITLVCILCVISCAAEEHIHNFEGTDMCRCGYINSTHGFSSSISFFTIKDNVPIWSKPTSKDGSVKLYTISDVGTRVEIDGLLRNYYDNIWLKIANTDSYVFVDNVYLDFHVLVAQSADHVSAISNMNGGVLTAFYEVVKPGGVGDFKTRLNPGKRVIGYNVLMRNSLTFRDEPVHDCIFVMSAEELGNIHYGYLGRMEGISEKTLLYAGGAVNQVKNGIDVGACISSYCDAPDDVDDVIAGTRYYDYTVFNWFAL